jgi:hypothetical protein
MAGFRCLFVSIGIAFGFVGCGEPTVDLPKTNLSTDLPARKDVSDTLMDELCSAIVQGNTKHIDTFLKLNPNLNRLNSLGESPLTLAATLGEFDLVKQFVNAGAEVDFPNHLGRTPLHKTIIHFENKHASRIVSHLLQAGAKPDPVDIAVTSMKILSTLEKHGADRSAGFDVPGMDTHRLVDQAKALLDGGIRTLSSNQVELLKAVVSEADRS